MEGHTVIFTSSLPFRDLNISKILSKISDENEMPKLYHFSDFLDESALLTEQPSSTQITPSELLNSQREKHELGKMNNVIYFIEVFEKETAKSLEKLMMVARHYLIDVVIIISSGGTLPPSIRCTVQQIYASADIDRIERIWMPKKFANAIITF